MPKKSSNELAEKTRAIRLEMHRLIHKEGMTEQQALIKVTPGDANRSKKFRRWKEAGLWPIPKEELKQAGHTTPKLHATTQARRAASRAAEKPLDSGDAPQYSEHIPQLDPELLATLREMAEWWKTRKIEEADLTELTTRPRFAGERHNSSVRLNKALSEGALKKASKPEFKARTGANLSGLLEWLLWGFLNHDARYLVASPDTTESDQ